MVAEELAAAHSESVADDVDLECLDVPVVEEIVKAGAAGLTRSVWTRSERVDCLEEALLESPTQVGPADAGTGRSGERDEGLERQSLEVGRVVEVGEGAVDLPGELVGRPVSIGVGLREVWSRLSGWQGLYLQLGNRPLHAGGRQLDWASG